MLSKNVLGIMVPKYCTRACIVGYRESALDWQISPPLSRDFIKNVTQTDVESPDFCGFDLFLKNGKLVSDNGCKV
jgi:hypothetical protein